LRCAQGQDFARKCDAEGVKDAVDSISGTTKNRVNSPLHHSLYKDVGSIHGKALFNSFFAQMIVAFLGR
jgi:hypothetical protein